jgi:hypothetical protein
VKLKTLIKAFVFQTLTEIMFENSKATSKSNAELINNIWMGIQSCFTKYLCVEAPSAHITVPLFDFKELSNTEEESRHKDEVNDEVITIILFGNSQLKIAIDSPTFLNAEQCSLSGSTTAEDESSGDAKIMEVYSFLKNESKTFEGSMSINLKEGASNSSCTEGLNIFLPRSMAANKSSTDNNEADKEDLRGMSHCQQCIFNVKTCVAISSKRNKIDESYRCSEHCTYKDLLVLNSESQTIKKKETDNDVKHSGNMYNLLEPDFATNSNWRETDNDERGTGEVSLESLVEKKKILLMRSVLLSEKVNSNAQGLCSDAAAFTCRLQKLLLLSENAGCRRDTLFYKNDKDILPIKSVLSLIKKGGNNSCTPCDDRASRENDGGKSDINILLLRDQNNEECENGSREVSTVINRGGAGKYNRDAYDCVKVSCIGRCNIYDGDKGGDIISNLRWTNLTRSLVDENTRARFGGVHTLMSRYDRSSGNTSTVETNCEDARLSSSAFEFYRDGKSSAISFKSFWKFRQAANSTSYNELNRQAEWGIEGMRCGVSLSIINSTNFPSEYLIKA